VRLQDATAEVRIPCSSPAAAEALAAALRVDDAEGVATLVEGTVVVARARAETIGRLLSGIDDWIACAGAATGARGALSDSA